MKKKALFSLTLLLGCCSLSVSAFAVDFDAAALKARETLAALIEADTTNPPGNEVRAVEIAAKKLKQADIAYEITEFAPGRQNIVARLKGSGKQGPVLLLAHTDVVGAGGQAWSVDPHKLTERDGYLYGRGVADDLGPAVVNLEALILLKASGVKLKRDVIVALTGDEESGGQGIRYLIKNKRQSIQADFAVNELGGPVVGSNGKVAFVGVQSAEKTYQDFELTTDGKTGHSSVPHPDNAIYRLSRALDRLGSFKFPARLNPVTRAYLEARAKVEPAEMASAMRAAAQARGPIPAKALATLESNAIVGANLRTTCVATLINGGTRVNALPATASAKVNCRILPDENAAQVQKQLEAIIADPVVKVKPIEDLGSSGGSPVAGADLDRLRALIGQMWPGVPIMPFQSLGATDSRFLREIGIKTYGMSALPMTEEDGRRAHGIDERIPSTSLRVGVEFFYKLLIALAAEDAV